MPRDSDQITNLAAEVDALDSPSTVDVLAHSQDYDAGIVAAEALRRSLTAGGGGGGGSLPEGWNLQSDATTPVSTVTPTAKGALYLNTNTAALYIALGETDGDWFGLAGPTSDAPGFISGLVPFVMAAANQNATIQDRGAQAGTGNGFYWNYDGNADGHQNAGMQVGASLLHMWPEDGTYAPAKGIVFPTADPHVAGAWWDNAGTLTKSAG